MRTMWTTVPDNSVGVGMIEGTGFRSGFQHSPAEDAGSSSIGTPPPETPDAPDAPLFSQRTKRRRDGWASSLLRTTIAVTAFAMLLGAHPIGAQQHANRPDLSASVQAARLGAQSFAVGSPLAPIESQAIAMRSPSAKDLKSEIESIKDTIERGHTDYMTAFFEPGVGASVTRYHNAWNDSNPYNTQYTIKTLPKDGMIHVTMPVFVSGHTPDQYDADLYPKYTGAPMPDDVTKRKIANAKLYANPKSPKHNVHWIWLHREGAGGPDQTLMPGLRADGEYVRTVQLALSAKPGDTLVVRWSPFTGPDPEHPIVAPEDFVGGRTFTIIVPKDVEVER